MIHDKSERDNLKAIIIGALGILLAGYVMLSATGCRSSRDKAPSGYVIDTYPSNSTHFIGQPQ